MLLKDSLKRFNKYNYKCAAVIFFICNIIKDNCWFYVTYQCKKKRFIKGSVHRFYVGGPRSRLQLGNTVYFKVMRKFFF